jgi:branched-chain amino acid transport system permease protein
VLTILFDGVAYGMLLFVLACGLSVTLGLMNFVNLAHGAFAMAGGYVAAILTSRHGVPFLASLPVAFAVPALIGVVLERTLYRRLYGRSHLDQVLFSIGLAFMAVAAVDYAIGSQQQFMTLPAWLQGRVEVLGIQVGLYRSFIIVVCGLIVVALQLVLTQTRFGSRLRAAVDDRRVAQGLGIRVDAIFAVTFAVGSGLAGLGGALGAEILGLDPTFPFKFMIYFLIVVTVGGTSSITGPFLASLLLGIGDVAGKYVQGIYLFKLFNYDVRIPNNFGAFIIYIIMIVVLIWRPQGLFSRAVAK